MEFDILAPASLIHLDDKGKKEIISQGTPACLIMPGVPLADRLVFFEAAIEAGEVVVREPDPEHVRKIQAGEYWPEEEV